MVCIVYSHQILNHTFCLSGILASIMTWYLSERSNDPQTELQLIDLKNSRDLLMSMEKLLELIKNPGPDL